MVEINSLDACRSSTHLGARFSHNFQASHDIYMYQQSIVWLDLLIRLNLLQSLK